MKKIAYLIIVAGLLILLYPEVSDRLHDYQQQKLLAEGGQLHSHSFAEQYVESSAAVEQHYEELSFIFQQGLNNDWEVDRQLQEVDKESIPLGSPSFDGKHESSTGQASAILIIDKIDLRLPVLEGATEKNMEKAAARIKETSQFGEIGNVGVAAHRVRKKGRLFNRLDEITVGDQIIVKQKGEEFIYTVFNTDRVTPDDVSVLNRNSTDKILTLITCDPIVNPTHRLIVHAKM